jgi:hypothetical protein
MGGVKLSGYRKRDGTYLSLNVTNYSASVVERGQLGIMLPSLLFFPCVLESGNRVCHYIILLFL